jgi:hypothetical protein
MVYVIEVYTIEFISQFSLHFSIENTDSERCRNLPKATQVIIKLMETGRVRTKPLSPMLSSHLCNSFSD